MDQRYRILLVFPSTEGLELQSALSADFEVVMAADAASAHHPLQFFEPDLAIVHLDETPQGLDCCSLLKRMHGFQHLSVVFLSAHDDAETARRAYGAGGCLLLKHPVDPVRLIRNLQMTAIRNGPPRMKKNAIGAPMPSDSIAPPPKPKTPPVPDAADDEMKRTDVFLERPLERKTSPAQASSAQAQPASRNWTAGARPRVMVVDDDLDMLELVQISLQDGFEVLSAMDGMQAMERIYDYEPDVVIVDVMMPKMNGFQLCATLRRNEVFHDTPVIFLSAKTAKKDQDYAFHCGATAYITKPFQVTRLTHVVHGITDGPNFRIRPKRFSYQDMHKRERALLKEKEQRQQQRDRSMDYENWKHLFQEGDRS